MYQKHFGHENSSDQQIYQMFTISSITFNANAVIKKIKTFHAFSERPPEGSQRNNGDQRDTVKIKQMNFRDCGKRRLM